MNLSLQSNVVSYLRLCIVSMLYLSYNKRVIKEVSPSLNDIYFGLIPYRIFFPIYTFALVASKSDFMNTGILVTCTEINNLNKTYYIQ